MGGTVLPVLTDVSKLSQVEVLAKKALETFGAVHLLCNNAGVSGLEGAIWENSHTDWEWVIGVNLWGVIHGIRVFIPLMLSQDTECHVVNTASTAGLLSYHPGATYHVTKHAVVALSEHLYRSLAEKGAKVKASVLCPGFVKTRILSSLRNLPLEYQVNTAAKPLSPEAEEAAWNFLIKNEFKVLSPDEVAGMVFTAIKEERFYILTHPEFNELVRRRMENIIQGQNPSLSPADFRN
jgi:NAD(P)-dependent dehydrogenase (short-subunit alcohol dehydrogenase family)